MATEKKPDIKPSFTESQAKALYLSELDEITCVLRSVAKRTVGLNEDNYDELRGCLDRVKALEDKCENLFSRLRRHNVVVKEEFRVEIPELYSSVLAEIDSIRGRFLSVSRPSASSLESKPGSPMAVETPLLLSEYLKDGRVEEGRKAARVEPLAGDVESYSGLLTVDPINGAHLFFWFFPAEAGTQAPLILWTSGLGTPAAFSVFNMSGPYTYNGQIGLREHSWTKHFNVIYFDAPVGVGFSFFKDPAGCPDSDEKSAKHLQIALMQFFNFFSELKDNDFYISGVSFSGKHSLHLANMLRKSTVNLKGVLLGAPLIEANSQIIVSDYLYRLGLLEAEDRDTVKLLEEKINDLVKEEQWEDAFNIICDYHIGKNFNRYMGPVSIFSPLRERTNLFQELLGNKEMHEKLHMTGNPPGAWDRAYKYYSKMFTSARHVLEEILPDIPLLIYCGQFDASLPIHIMEEFLCNLQWKGSRSFINAPRRSIFDGNKLVGFKRQRGNLTSVMVRNAGHFVSEDEPKVVLKVVSDFIKPSLEPIS